MTIAITDQVTPAFDDFGPYCVGASIPDLPTTSNNGITGTWSPAINNNATTLYTFTPTSGLCATTDTLTIAITDQVTPAFDDFGPYCVGASIPDLPTTSNNGITGTWSPAINNNATTLYTFTPTSGLCATTDTLTIAITDQVTPAFDDFGPYCVGASIPDLPTTSNNGITGTWSPAINNNATTLYTFTPTSGLCATTDTLTIAITDQVTPAFDDFGPYCVGASIPDLPTTSNNGITGTWSPAINNNATTLYTFTPTSGLCATTDTLTIAITDQVTPAFDDFGPYCVGASIPDLPTTSNNGITGTWSPAINNNATTLYTFTPTSGLCATTDTLTIAITDQVTPAFDDFGPYCVGASIPDLPTTSNNGITGTWSPAINNNATTLYTFTPTSGLCATTDTLTIAITDQVTPAFDDFGPYCVGASIPDLPTTSNNGITGTWSPAINNNATTLYTFTPTSGLCATTDTLTIAITDQVTPAFDDFGPYCVGASIPDLPTTSNNGITGTWSPAINNNATTLYTFTPTSGLCATTDTLTIAITDQVTPAFDDFGPYCVGASIPDLPTTSNNGITGTWSPAINNNATTLYTFTPTSGLCATTDTLTIAITDQVTPAFDDFGPYCVGASIPDLPTTSNNGITGTWSPAINNNATTLYTFTPTSGLCATTDTLTIAITDQVTPAFDDFGPYCVGASIPDLPTTSNNGITGTWSPAINNNATTLYTFTPTSGLCATTDTLTIAITDQVTPAFDDFGPYCVGASIPDLPTTSNNGITGTWSPAINNNATTLYTFTPTSGLCATTDTLTIAITDQVTPAFDDFGPYCVGASIPDLPTTSNNGITGTWSPAINNNATTLYTFTPTSGLCATTDTLTIAITDQVTPAFDDFGPYCVGASIPDLPTTSNNGITGTWSPAINNNATTLYTFTPTSGLCATTGYTGYLCFKSGVCNHQNINRIWLRRSRRCNPLYSYPYQYRKRTYKFG